LVASWYGEAMEEVVNDVRKARMKDEKARKKSEKLERKKRAEEYSRKCGQENSKPSAISEIISNKSIDKSRCNFIKIEKPANSITITTTEKKPILTEKKKNR
jgi:hypothetical protein